MKRLVLFAVSLFCSCALADEWETDKIIVTNGFEILLQHDAYGDCRTVAGKFVGDTVRLCDNGTVFDPSYGSLRWDYVSIKDMCGSTKTLYLPLNRFWNSRTYRSLYGIHDVETLVFPDSLWEFREGEGELLYLGWDILMGATGLKRVIAGPPIRMHCTHGYGYESDCYDYDSGSDVSVCGHSYECLETIEKMIWRTEEFYYPKKYEADWKRILKMIALPPKFKHGAFEGEEWTGLDCVISTTDNINQEQFGVITNYIYTTVTNVVYLQGTVPDSITCHATVTNVHVHYTADAKTPQFILPSSYDTGFVNVITEVKGGLAIIPATWSANYPGFTEKFGTDFSKALSKPTGKYDCAGNPMFVWQDYIAGTNPLDTTDVFKATIALVDGKLRLSYTPKLDDARTAMRKYTVLGKRSLFDSEWREVVEGRETECNFFKVLVEMR